MQSLCRIPKLNFGAVGLLYTTWKTKQRAILVEVKTLLTFNTWIIILLSTCVTWVKRHFIQSRQQIDCSIECPGWLYLTLLCDLSRNLATLSKPIRFKTKTHRNLVARAFRSPGSFPVFSLSSYHAQSKCALVVTPQSVVFNSDNYNTSFLNSYLNSLLFTSFLNGFIEIVKKQFMISSSKDLIAKAGSLTLSPRIYPIVN